MKDKRTLFAFIILILLIGFLIFLVLQKKNDDAARDVRINDLTTTIQSLNSKLTELGSVKPADGYTPQKGIDYHDGVDGKNGQPGPQGPSGKDGKDGKDGVNGLPAPELDIDCVANILMKKYSHDDFWQPTGIKCEVSHE